MSLPGRQSSVLNRDIQRMNFDSFWRRCRGRYQRAAAAYLHRRPFLMRNKTPIISFTFDDFPRSALLTGGTILEEQGLRGTYYASLGLMGKTAPTGRIFEQDDLPLTLERGHELGCHTFAHCDASQTSPALFAESIFENQRAISVLAPGPGFKTLSYPIGTPRPAVKKVSSRYFQGCRAGGQTYNSGLVDLNYLQAFFIEQCRDRPNEIKAIIDATCRDRGWLIFGTHDVCEHSTAYGCTPTLFEEIVRYSVGSGAQVVPVSKALSIIGATRPITA